MQSYTIRHCSYHNLQHCCNSVNICDDCKTYTWATVMASVSALLLVHLPYTTECSKVQTSMLTVLFKRGQDVVLLFDGSTIKPVELRSSTSKNLMGDIL